MSLTPKPEGSRFYRHARLPPNQFRLMTLQPAKDLEAPLVVSLQALELDGRKAGWDAISYYYGDGSLTHDVHIDGEILPINANAHSALKYCRYREGPRILWMDQICISQVDEEEKFEQIPMMGRIFRDANLVVVYLCDAWPGLEHFFSFLNTIGHQPRIWTLEYWLPRTTAPNNFPLRKMFNPAQKFPRFTWRRLGGLFGNAGRDSEAFVAHQERMLRAPWFLRLWVVQEATLARKLYVQCSNLVTSWDALRTSYDRILYWPVILDHDVAAGFRSASAIDTLRGWQPGQRPSLRRAWYSFKNDLKVTKPSGYWTLFMQTIQRLSTPRFPDFVSVLQDFRWQKSTDKRDKVYGLLGLASPTLAGATLGKSDDPSTPERRTISWVSYVFAVNMILQTGTLDVLTATCMNTRAHEDLPYWIPDWSQDPPVCDTKYAFNSNGLPHCAGTQYPADPEFIGKEQAIVLRGVKVDTVDEVLDDVLSIYDLHDPAAPIWTTWKDFAMKPVRTDLADPYIDEAGRYEAFWRALMYDSDGGGYRASATDHGQNFTRWLNGEFSPHTHEATYIAGRIVLKSRRLFRTKKGYVGNGCCEVTPGDPVYVLHGGKLPFVLRVDRVVEGVPVVMEDDEYEPGMKRMQGFKLVGGSAYVHGLADGQAWDVAERDGIELEEIALV